MPVTRELFLTSEGVARIQKELDFLKNVKLPDLAEILQDASVGGDTIDNTEFMILRDEVTALNGRIQELEDILRHSQLIQNQKRGVVLLGSSVTIQESDYEPETYMLVGTTEADPFRGYISNESPLGRELLNKQIGDIVKIKSPDGDIEYRILTIE